MSWNYSENPTPDLMSYLNSFTANRELGIPAHLHSKNVAAAHFLSKEINGDLLIIFDCEISARNNRENSYNMFETVYSVVSDKLNLPYFQTQPESPVGDNVVGTYFKRKAGLNDPDFPPRPVFSQKYIVDIRMTDISKVFTPPVFDFYEQNSLYRTIGDGKMLSLASRQVHPIDQNLIYTNLQTLQNLYQLLKND